MVRSSASRKHPLCAASAAVIDALESRTLLSAQIIYDLRAAPSGGSSDTDVGVTVSSNGKSVTIHNAGDFVELDLWAMVVNNNGNNKDDGFAQTHGSFKSSNGGLKGDLSGATVSPFQGPGSGGGVQTDLDGDGDKDDGDITTNGSANPFPWFVANTGGNVVNGGSGSAATWKAETVGGQAYTSFLVGKAFFTTSTTTGTTSIKYIPRLLTTGLPANQNLNIFKTDGAFTTLRSDSASVGAGDAVTISTGIVTPTTGTISGTVFNDISGDGNQSGAGENGISGIVLYLDANNNGSKDSGEDTATSNGSGAYTFNDVSTGTQRVRIFDTGGRTITRPQAGFYNFTVVGGQTSSGNFGLQTPAATTGTITGKVFNDISGDGNQGAGENAIAAKVLYLDSNNSGGFDTGEPTATTNGSGVYTFSDVPVGTQRVRVKTLDAGQTVVKPQAGFYNFTVAGGQTSTGDFALRTAPTTGTITGKVFNDISNDGNQGAGENGISGKVLYLDANNSGGFDNGETTATTNSSGVYTFNSVPLGTQRVRLQTLDAGQTVKKPQAGFYNFTVAGGQTSTGDFALHSAPTTGTITGTIFNDLNANGVKTSNEAGLKNRRVWLDANNNGALDGGEATMLSDANGQFTFSNVTPGTQRVREQLLAPWRITRPQAGFYNFTVTAGGVFNGDFGLTQRAAITGTVFKDTNGNGAFNTPSELGLSGWSVFIDLDKDGKFNHNDLITSSDSKGNFNFANLAAGTYLVRETLKSGFKRTTATGGAFTIKVDAGKIGTVLFGNKPI